MAKLAKPADVLKPCPADEVYKRITAWHEAENPSPEELIEWLDHTTEQLEHTVAALNSDKDKIGQCDDLTRLKATSMVLNSLDFLDRADVAAELMAGVVGGRVRDAFVEGLRIGLLYEKIMSLIDGRYSDHWMRQEGRQRGANTTNEAHAELRQQYQPAVDRLIADGLSYSAACESAGPTFGVSAKTIKRHTTNPAPRNRGR